MNILKLEGIGIKIGGYLSNTQIVEITEKKKKKTSWGYTKSK